MKIKIKTLVFLVLFFAFFTLFSLIANYEKRENERAKAVYEIAYCNSDFESISARKGENINLEFLTLSDDSSGLYIVENKEGGYVAKTADEEISQSTLSSLIAMIEKDGVIIEFSDISAGESLNITKSLTLSGSLRLENANLNLSGEEIKLSDFSFTGEKSSVRVKSGTVYAKSGAINTSSSSAVILDFNSAARFVCDGTDISSATSGAAIVCEIGSIEIFNGSVKNGYGAAIENSGSLSLCKNAEISGLNFDVVTDRHISFLDSDFSENILRVKYEKTFEKGSFSVVFQNAESDDLESIVLYDKNGEKVSLEYFEECAYTDEKNTIAVYLPYSVKFYSDTLLYATEYFLKGEPVEAPQGVEKSGYSFIGWYKDTLFSEPYVFGEGADSDFSLYAAFSLVEPRFSISSLEFSYDGKKHSLGFDYLSHPLAEKGQFSFVWYKNSEPILNSSPTLEILNVYDSGEYFCKLTFSFCGDFVHVTTPTVSVNVNKMIIKTPEITALKYTGLPQLPSVPESPFYSFCDELFTDVGTHYVTLTLYDFENCRWSAENSEKTLVSFEILQAENEFTVSPSCENIYEGEALRIEYKLKFGVGFAEYSKDGLTWSETLPQEAGKYYLRITAAGTENYTELISDILEFTVYDEVCTGIKIDKYPDKTKYPAFEILDLSGSEFSAYYNSGRSEKIDHSSLKIEYKNGACFLVTDSSATVVYKGYSVPVAVSVFPAEYDISGVIFDDCETTYNGLRHTVNTVCDIVGKDGIALGYKITGGGIDAGEYSVTLSFTTDSINYNVPAPITKKLTVKPMSLPVVYTNIEFVYDGTPKIPSATIIGAQGMSISVTLLGAATDAGVYIATANLSDKNYTLENVSVEFRILKADFDVSGVVWSAEKFVYNGENHSVFISGLPNGIKLLGYVNSSFSDAGSYIAEAAVSYDEKNYNSPGRFTHSWSVERADYVFGDFGFSDSEFIFDGAAHYPIVSGSAPTGIDGISLQYSFSDGAVHVSEGRKAVTVTFESLSKNYNVPQPVTAYVEILPKPIEIEWGALTFVYDGSEHIPISKSSECKVKITGIGVDAGEYVAFAVSENQDYEIVNNQKTFTITKAENSWITEISASDIYDGDSVCVLAEALAGEIVYRFYKNAELSEEVEAPLQIGTYYVVCEALESKNYNALISEAIQFSVLEILPVELKVEFLEPIVAMKALTDIKFIAYLLNNNGSHTPLGNEEISAVYQRADVFLAGDTALTVFAGGFSLDLEISVAKSVIELPFIAPLTYNGEVRLPPELSSPLFTTDFSGAKDAGKYVINFTLTDSENYEFKDGISTSLLLINRAPITLSVNKNGSSYEIAEGAVFSSDELFCEYYEENGKIYLRINNPNYDLTVIPREEKSGGIYVLIVFLTALVIVLTSLGLYIVFARKEKRVAIANSSMNEKGAETVKSAQKSTLSEKSSSIEPPLATLLAVDESYANNLISDLVAKSLITEEDRVVETDGKRRYILNLDTISDNFSAGESVNINDFKKKGLLPQDAKYVKILARGVIDKPITILANSFSLSAVKMIALTGGNAKRVRTVKRKF